MAKGPVSKQPENSYVLRLLDKALHSPCPPLPRLAVEVSGRPFPSLTALLLPQGSG